MSLLIDAGELDTQGPSVVLCASMGPTSPTSGIPGSFLADLEADFSDQASPLPHTARADLPALFDSYGISDDTPVVIYDQQAGATAPRVWWLARAAGLTNVRVLDGPWTGETAPFARPSHRGTITGPPHPGLLIDAAMVTASPRLVVDARSAGQREDLTFSCGSGVTACVDAFAAALAGYDDLAVYEESWSEWGRPDSGREVATS
ncbi:sulfurtransferase [Corynebacterium testudinoris]|uniref:Rhodanese-related sulfurtransferase n=1 Tax=Corynebacterium testudinoris TaxID=136857 RepID=A0A0G3HC20_9CORY|nr:rhodanese-like domain-containing protein [Corynebacterium testudinoris]AKK08697.1 rhodanese-related sulfurtransferase [Corynebacterium testudinoris]MBX8996978.1 sulfurtransferase [Corynebacterium testudinoris]